MNFIGESFINPQVCDEIVKYFELETTEKSPGRSLLGFDKSVKDSMDCTLKGDTQRLYVREFQQCLEKYKKEYPMCDEGVERWDIVEAINVQRYLPGQWYKKWHCERSGNSPRHLVFMTYLNTVSEGGETEFYHQNIKVKPEKGKTLIWPCEWTHTHRGIVSNSELKYIVTGWISFLPDNIHLSGTYP